jgi:hypothetical protein
VVKATVRNNIDHLVQTFRDDRQKNPTLDPDGSFSLLLSGQLAGYGSLDPPAKRQKAISLNVLLTLYDLAESPSNLATADLAMGAFFFACRSCQYLKVTGARRTKTLQVGDIHFRKGKTALPHSSPNLHLADTVSLTFRDQKNWDKMATRSAWSTAHALASPPVVAWANIVRRVQSLPNSGDRTHVFQCQNAKNKTGAITDAFMIQKLRAAVHHLGVHSLGYSSADVSTHSIRSGAAIALVLSHHAAWRIMLAGRWKSSSFLLYIREQVQEHSARECQRECSKTRTSTTYRILTISPHHTHPPLSHPRWKPISSLAGLPTTPCSIFPFLARHRMTVHPKNHQQSSVVMTDQVLPCRTLTLTQTLTSRNNHHKHNNNNTIIQQYSNDKHNGTAAKQ